MVSERKAAGRMRLLDMHAHLSCFMDKSKPGVDTEERHALALRELEQRRSDNISTFFSSGTLDEWKFMQRYRSREEIFLSFGIHPWEASHRVQSVRESLAEAFETCDAIGEIGMDSVWCEVPLDIQRRSFEKQLQIAADLKKPVILHTKGMEREIAAMVRDFPEPVCVHWYSGGLESLEAFLGMGCYFTLGPDLSDVCRKRSMFGNNGGMAETEKKETLYRTMLREIPVERLFVETDGISSIAWARGTEVAELSEVPEVLSRNMDLIAETKNIQRDELNERMWRNLGEFFRKTGRG